MIRETWRRMRERREARKEVEAELRRDPFLGLGLYYIYDDADLITARARERLEPLVRNVQRRFERGEEQPVIRLPMTFEPLTDVEYDTLTAVIGDALKAFARNVHRRADPVPLAELVAVIHLLERHVDHTAKLHLEISIHDLLGPVVKNLGRRVDSRVKQAYKKSRPGDFFLVYRPNKTRNVTQKFIKQRKLERGDWVRIVDSSQRGYLLVERLGPNVPTPRGGKPPWHPDALPRDGSRTLVHYSEGEFFRLPDRLKPAVDRLIELFRAHRDDRSPDPQIYQPTGPREDGG